MSPRSDDKPKDDGKIIPFPLPKKPAPTNPEPKCACGLRPSACPVHDS